jgi:hypothetical protein
MNKSNRLIFLVLIVSSIWLTPVRADMGKVSVECLTTKSNLLLGNEICRR